MALAADAVEIYSDRRDTNGDRSARPRRRRGPRHGPDHLQRAALQPDAGAARRRARDPGQDEDDGQRRRAGACRRSASTTRSASACRSTSWATGRSRRPRPTTSRRRSGATASSSRTSRSCSCAASSSDGWGAGTAVARHGPHVSRAVVPRRRLSRRDRRARAAFQRGTTTSAFAASPRRSPRAARTCISSPRCRPSRAATTSGRCSARSTCRSGNRNRGSDLGTSFAYRSSDYSSVGRFDSWKVGLDFQIFRDLRFRATKSRDVREATFTERFDNAPSGGSVNDPARNGLQSTVTITTVGNPNLVPEEADTTVFGLVYQPSWAEGLRMSVDRYDIDISDSIATLGAQRVVDECYQQRRPLRVRVSRRSRRAEPRREPVLESRSRPRGGHGRRNSLCARRRLLRSARRVAIDPHARRQARRAKQHRRRRRARAVRRYARSGGSTVGVFADITANLTVSYRVARWSVQLQERYIDDVLLNRTWVEGVDVDNNTIDSEEWTNLVLAFEGRSGERGLVAPVVERAESLRRGPADHPFVRGHAVRRPSDRQYL